MGAHENKDMDILRHESVLCDLQEWGKFSFPQCLQNFQKLLHIFLALFYLIMMWKGLHKQKIVVFSTQFNFLRALRVYPPKKLKSKLTKSCITPNFEIDKV